MNAHQLTKNVGEHLRLRPKPRRVIPQVVVMATGLSVTRQETVETDYRWRLEDVSDKCVTLQCPHTGHKITLGADNVREYRTPDFLLLKCQLTLDDDGVHIEPL